jgi:hypothetical protein
VLTSFYPVSALSTTSPACNRTDRETNAEADNAGIIFWVGIDNEN